MPRQYAAQTAKYTKGNFSRDAAIVAIATTAGVHFELTRPGDHAKQSGRQGEAAAQLPILALLDQAAGSAGQAARVLPTVRAAPPTGCVPACRGLRLGQRVSGEPPPSG